MTLDALKRSLATDDPPAVSVEVLALWYEARGDWQRAHETVQDLDTREAAWVHAYLHRREGDASNARYWYRRANEPECREPLPAEWDAIAEALLADQRPPA